MTSVVKYDSSRTFHCVLYFIGMGIDRWFDSFRLRVTISVSRQRDPLKGPFYLPSLQGKTG